MNAHKPIDSVAWLKHFEDLDDATRWRLMVHIMRSNQPPPQDTFDRAHRQVGFRMHEGAGVVAENVDAGAVKAVNSAVGADRRKKAPRVRLLQKPGPTISPAGNALKNPNLKSRAVSAAQMTSRANAAGVLGHNGAACASPLSAHARNATVA